MKKFIIILGIVSFTLSGSYSQSNSSTALSITNVQPLNSGCLQKITQVQGITFRYAIPQIYSQSSSSSSGDDTSSNKIPDFYNTDQHGFQLDIFNRLFPELVVKDAFGNQAINYNGLIPILVEALKEQETTIESLKSDIILLKQKLNLSTSNTTSLGQSTGQ